MLHSIHGNGKGKTTAAFGMVLRQLGHGKKVLILQFLKDGDSGEMKALQVFENVCMYTKNLPQTFYKQMSEEDKATCRIEQVELFAIAQAQTPYYDCIILDEVLDVLGMSILDEDEIMAYLTKHKEHHEIILTGRNPSKRIQECSDYDSEIVMKKHPYTKGITMRKGVEY